MPRPAVAAAAVATLALALAAAHGCADCTPSREALDRVWHARMLEGRYGLWRDTGDPLPPWEPGQDWIASNPALARVTRYGLEVSAEGPAACGAAWHLAGGLVGRAPTRGGLAAELFVKEIARSPGTARRARSGPEPAYDVFLLLRPSGGGRGRLVRTWSIPPGDVARAVDPRVEDVIRRSFPPGEAAAILAQNAVTNVEAFVAVDSGGTVATVTVTGLTRPFAERVDLAEALGTAR